MNGVRRALGLAAAAFLVLTAVAAHAQGLPDEMSLGNPAAKVTLIEYGSLGCPHCGAWAREVWPQFKRQFVDTGQVRFVLREMLTGDADMAAAGFLTARCAGRDKYFQVVAGLFAAQPQMMADGDDLPTLLKVAAQAGLSNTQVSACLSDHAALSALEARVDRWAREDGVEATPTFDVNGRKFAGETSLADLAQAIAAAEAAPHRKR